MRDFKQSASLIECGDPLVHAGRAFAAYGGIYTVLPLLWLVVVDGKRASLPDIDGVALCLTGAAIIGLSQN